LFNHGLLIFLEDIIAAKQDRKACSHRIYDHAAETKSFDALRSTRFFGPMAFYFAWNKNVELLLIDMIQRDL
jgi:small subunit ribosomal protein S22